LPPELLSLLAGQAQAQTSSGGDNLPPGVLVQFRAGKMNKTGTTVTADPRKGKLVIKWEEGLLHWQWKTRPEDRVEDDLIIFPEDLKAEWVPECTSGRVFLFRFSSDPSKKVFIWLQEPNEDKDEELLKKLNEVLKSPPPDQGLFSGSPPAGTSPVRSGFATTSGASAPASDVPSSADASSASPARSSTSTSTTGTSAPAPASALDLASAFVAALGTQREQAPGTSLNGILDPELVIPILRSDPDILAAVVGHLPEGQRDDQSVMEQLRSPQLQQTLSRVTDVLNRGQGSSLLAQLGLDASAGVGVEGLLAALESYAKQEAEKRSKESSE